MPKLHTVLRSLVLLCDLDFLSGWIGIAAQLG